MEVALLVSTSSCTSCSSLTVVSSAHAKGSPKVMKKSPYWSWSSGP